ncbi:RNA-directed DNA polymerase, eukaryota, partial [Tanacetum coccineum]
MYADDVIFFGEWSRTNAHNLICMLRCFFLISGLKINVHKSSVLGVSVSNDEVTNMASVIGFSVAKLPFKYLRVSVGCNMAKCANWSAIFQKFSSKLSFWKARLLSVGGRLSLIKSVLGNLPTYYMSIYKMPSYVQNKLESMCNNFFIGGDQEDKKMTWVKWKKCLASKDLGGLGIGSICGLNMGLLFKWLWRFLTRPTDLWAQVVKNIYGVDGGFNKAYVRRLGFSTWGAIMTVVHKLKMKGTDLLSYCTRKIGNGPPLAIIGNVVLTNHCDSWHWTLNVASGFSVASVRCLVDARTLDVDSNAT